MKKGRTGRERMVMEDEEVKKVVAGGRRRGRGERQVTNRVGLKPWLRQKWTFCHRDAEGAPGVKQTTCRRILLDRMEVGVPVGVHDSLDAKCHKIIS